MKWTVAEYLVGTVIGLIVGLLTHDVILAIIASAGFVAVVMLGARFFETMWVGEDRHAAHT